MVATFEIKHSFATRVPRERRILVLTEPVADLPARYVNQFGILVAPQFIRSFSGIWHRSHGALPSAFARDVTSRRVSRRSTAYDELVALQPPEKRDAITVVVSGKTLLPGHRRRLRFLRLLKDAIGDRLEVYGDGLHKIPVKADAILPYKYHLVLENTVMPSYWTEKLADAYLGYALPVVSGPNNLAEWFPEESFVPIDIDDPARAIATIKAVIDDDIYAAPAAGDRRSARSPVAERKAVPADRAGDRGISEFGGSPGRRGNDHAGPEAPPAGADRARDPPVLLEARRALSAPIVAGRRTASGRMSDPPLRPTAWSSSSGRGPSRRANRRRTTWPGRSSRRPAAGQARRPTS